MVSIVILLLIVLYCSALGGYVLRVFRLGTLTLAERFVFSAGLGLAAFSYVIYAIGLVALLKPSVILLVIFVSGVFLLPEMVRTVASIAKALRAFRPGSLNVVTWIISAFLAVSLVMVLLGALAPATGADALCYHLTCPKIFVQQHQVSYLKNVPNSLYPFLVEMLFAFGLMVRDTSLAKLFHTVFAILGTVGVYAFARRRFDVNLSVAAAAAFFLAPGLVNGATFANVDAGTVFYALLVFYGLLMWLERDAAGWLAFSGVCCGLALATKHLALMLLVTINVAIIVAGVFGDRKGIRKLAKALVLFNALAIAIVLPWYARAYWYTGNPIHPFLAEVFGQVAASSGPSIKGPRNIQSLVMLPWNMTVNPEQYGGNANQLGPLFLAAIPGLLFLKRWDRSLRYMMLMVFVYFMLWFALTQNLRFFLVCLPLLSVAVIYVVDGLRYRFRLAGHAVLLAMVGVLAFESALTIYYNRDSIRVTLGLESPDSYLTRKERSYFGAKFAQAYLPAEATVAVVGEIRFYYLDRDFLWYGGKSSQNLDAASMEDVVNNLKDAHVTHILVRRAPSVRADPEKTFSLYNLTRDERFRRNYLRLVAERVFEGADEKSEYSLFELL